MNEGEKTAYEEEQIFDFFPPYIALRCVFIEESLAQDIPWIVGLRDRVLVRVSTFPRFSGILLRHELNARSIKP